MTTSDTILTVSDAVTVFFSYARDDRKRAQPVIAALEARGFKVWWDDLLEGGDSFLPTTEAALNEADVVVVLWTKTSIASHWVRDEATVGRDRQRLVPLSLDGSEPPLGFRQFQVIDIRKWRGRGDAPEMQRLTSAITALTGRAPVDVHSAKSGISRRSWMIGGAALASVGGGLAIWKLVRPNASIAGESVAVLPFDNLSGDPAQAYFSDGLSEEIRLGLSRNDGLRVLAPMSAGKAAEQYKDAQAIAQALGATYLLRGSVRRSGDNLRIAAELLNGKTGSAEWSDQFDRTMTDIFVLQGEIAGSVADVLSAQLAGTEGKPVGKDEMGGTNSVRAYDAYLRGNAYYALRSGEAAYRAALKQYDAALAIDDDYAKAHAARARVITVITNSYAKADEFKARYDDAVASAKKAVKIAPKLAIAQSTLGFVLVQGRLDLKGAQKPYELANSLGRGDGTVQMLYAAYAAEMSEHARALTAVTRATELDPLNPAAHRMEAFVHYCARQFDPAIAACKKALGLNARLDKAQGYMGDALLQQGKFDDARSAYIKEPDFLTRQTGLAVVDGKLGRQDSAESAMSALIAEIGDGSTYQQAQILAQWGRADEALQKLIFARKIGDVGLALAGIDPLLDPLRKRPEFSDLLKDLGFG